MPGLLKAGVAKRQQQNRRRTAGIVGILLAAGDVGNEGRRFGIHDVNRERERHGEFHHLYRELRDHEDRFFQYLRLSCSQFDTLLEKVRLRLTKTSMRKPISPEERLVVTLRCLAAGIDFKVAAYNFRMGESTVSMIVRETCDAIYKELRNDFLKMPSSRAEWEKIAEEFYEKWQMPLCMGAIDGKHVVLKCPKNSGSSFYNYKGTFSLILLGVSDADYNFIHIDVGTPGRLGDGYLFGTSKFAKCLANGRMKLPPPARLPNSQMEFYHYFVTDEAFPISANLMKPYGGRNVELLEHHKRIFNYRLSRARRVIENTFFGILACRWRFLHKQMQCNPETAEKMVKAACVLHNFARVTEINSTEPRRYMTQRLADFEENNGVTREGDWRQITAGDTGMRNIPYGPPRRSRTLAFNLRDSLAHYFVNEGAIEWQESYQGNG